jgi:hypothetical protein
MKRPLVGSCLLLVSCTSYKPPPAPEPREATHVDASMGRTWDGVIDQFAARNIPIRTIERVSGLIVTDELTVGTDGYWWADCGQSTGWSTTRRRKPRRPAEANDTVPITNPNHLGPTHATYNILVRGDSLESTVKATVRWTHISEKAVVKECTTNHSWERGFEQQVKTRAEVRKPAAKMAASPVGETTETVRSDSHSRADSVSDVPPGTKWIANRQTKTYYQVGCAAAASIAPADRLFYATESAALVAGFTASREC